MPLYWLSGLAAANWFVFFCGWLGSLAILPLMPAYPMTVFWFRVSRFLYALAEPGQWSVKDPLTQSRSGQADLISKTAAFVRKTFPAKKP